MLLELYHSIVRTKHLARVRDHPLVRRHLNNKHSSNCCFLSLKGQCVHADTIKDKVTTKINTNIQLFSINVYDQIRHCHKHASRMERERQPIKLMYIHKNKCQNANATQPSYLLLCVRYIFVG